MEIWKPIPGFNLYHASNMGRLKTFNWKNKGYTRIMKPALNRNGYLQTMLLNDEGKWCNIKVHRMIGITFIPNPENKPEINHKNGIRSDNREINLEWLTHPENIKDSFTQGRSSNKGEGGPTHILTDEIVIQIRKEFVRGRINQYQSGLTKKQLGEKYGVCAGTIKMIIQNKTWTHLL